MQASQAGMDEALESQRPYSKQRPMTQSNTTQSLFHPMKLDAKTMERTIRRIQKQRRKAELDSRAWRVMNLYGIEIREDQMRIMNATV